MARLEISKAVFSAVQGKLALTRDKIDIDHSIVCRDLHLRGVEWTALKADKSNRVWAKQNPLNCASEDQLIYQIVTIWAFQ